MESIMKSNKQRRAEIMAKRNERKQRQFNKIIFPHPKSGLKVNRERLGAHNYLGYSVPEFVIRGTYEPVAFNCQDCGAEQVWSGKSQKWWYEVMLGTMHSTAIRCRPCRAKERERIANARIASAEGRAQKLKQKQSELNSTAARI
jgi:hypothetical protein